MVCPIHPFLNPIFFLSLFFLNGVPIHQLFLCLHDETPGLVDNFMNSLDLTRKDEILHESFSTTKPQFFSFFKCTG